MFGVALVGLGGLAWRIVAHLAPRIGRTGLTELN